jgi:hypothetical protein
LRLAEYCNVIHMPDKLWVYSSKKKNSRQGKFLKKKMKGLYQIFWDNPWPQWFTIRMASVQSWTVGAQIPLLKYFLYKVVVAYASLWFWQSCDHYYHAIMNKNPSFLNCHFIYLFLLLLLLRLTQATPFWFWHFSHFCLYQLNHHY